MNRLNYKGYIIEPNDYPDLVRKYMYSHVDETDGRVEYCKTIDECKQEIDEIDY